MVMGAMISLGARENDDQSSGANVGQTGPGLEDSLIEFEFCPTIAHLPEKSIHLMTGLLLEGDYIFLCLNCS